MPRPETEPVAGRDRSEIGQDAVIEAEGLDRAGIFGLAVAGIIAARDQDRGAVVGREPDLMGVDAGVEVFGLRHACAQRAIAIDAMHGHGARCVMGHEQITAAGVDTGMDGARRQRRRTAMRPQRPGRLIDGESAGVMLVAGQARSAGTRDHIQKTPRRMRPGVLNIGRQRYRAAFRERGLRDVEIVKRQHGTDAGVINGSAHKGLRVRDYGSAIAPRR